MNIAINGFGRIGRSAFRRALEFSDIRVVAINDLGDADVLAHLLEYDTVYGRYERNVSSSENAMIVDGIEYPLSHEKDPALLPWKELSIDVVLECTGVFRTLDGAKKHLEAGAKRVLLSAPPKGEGIPMIVIGANEDDVSAHESILSSSSCTTNCIAPLMSVLQEAFGVEKAMMTTTHAYTSDQRLVDAPHKDLRRARAAAANIVPTTTGAARATTKVVSGVKHFDGLSIRVPVACGSLADMTAVLSREVTAEDVNKALSEASRTDRYKDILLYSEDPLVSSDVIGMPYSAVIDSQLTSVVGGNLVKVIAWYDNEWGYSCRYIDQVRRFLND